MKFPKPEKRPKTRKRPRRQRKGTLPALKRKLWSLVAQYVKGRDGAVCFSCGRTGLSGANWHAGHLFAAGGSSLIRYEPKNIHSQCYFCNVNLGGNGASYAQRFMVVYGRDEFDRLYRLSREMKQWKAWEMEDLIAALESGAHQYECLYAERYGLSTSDHLRSFSPSEQTDRGSAGSGPETSMVRDTHE